MTEQKLKIVVIKEQDFSDRKYFPGTPSHPFHVIDDVQAILSKLPTSIYPFLLGGIIYLISGNLSKAILLTAFMLLDWCLLSLLPVFHISFGPPILTVIVLGVMRTPFLFFSLTYSLLFQSLGTILVIWGFYIEPQFPKVDQYHIHFPTIHSSKKQIRIVHLSDLHMEYITNREERIIQKVNEISPDLVLFTGDFFNLSYQNNPETFRAVIQFFNQLHAKEGAFGVTGSVSVDLDESIRAIEPKMKMRLLHDESVDLAVNGLKINLIGLECTHQPGLDTKRLKSILHKGEYDSSVLLYHSPDIAPAIQDLPIDLQLSGHTHGGQVQLPIIGPIYSGSLYRLKLTSGFYKVNQSPYLVISRGLGLEGEAAPRVRFLSPPEIGYITLEYNQDNVK